MICTCQCDALVHGAFYKSVHMQWRIQTFHLSVCVWGGGGGGEGGMKWDWMPREPSGVLEGPCPRLWYALEWIVRKKARGNSSGTSLQTCLIQKYSKINQCAKLILFSLLDLRNKDEEFTTTTTTTPTAVAKWAAATMNSSI